MSGEDDAGLVPAPPPIIQPDRLVALAQATGWAQAMLVAAQQARVFGVPELEAKLHDLAVTGPGARGGR